MGKNLEKIAVPLLKWYDENKRDLLWRKDKNPYHVWVSEIMLQQTRVEAVKKYYLRFMETLPTIDDLADVSEERLLKLWEGLGYYTRARNLKKTAQIVVEKYFGEFPISYEELIKLPGIGSYTAGAIASICFDEKVPAVDGNVLRVLTRVCNGYEIIDLLETKKNFFTKLQKVLPDRVGDFNQALMELGALVCVPNGAPECSRCPLQKLCVAYENNTQLELPRRLAKKERKKQEKTVLLYVYQNKVAIQKRPKTGLLANLYEFPNIDEKGSLSETKKYLKEKEIPFIKIESIGTAKHIFTHIQWHMMGYLISVLEPFGSYNWVSYSELEEKYPLPNAFQFFKKLLRQE